MITRVAFILLLLTASAQAVDIKVVVPEIREHTQDGWITRRSAVITVSGHFEMGDSLKFRDVIGRIESSTIYLSSSGGNALAGAAIGQITREKNFHTAILNQGRCTSACAIAWLGGTERFLGLGSIVGFHTPYTKESITYGTTTVGGVTAVRSEGGLGGAAMVRGYVINILGLSDDAALYVTEAPPERFNMLTEQDSDRVGIKFTRMNIPGYDPLP